MIEQDDNDNRENNDTDGNNNDNGDDNDNGENPDNEDNNDKNDSDHGFLVETLLCWKKHAESHAQALVPIYSCAVAMLGFGSVAISVETVIEVETCPAGHFETWGIRSIHHRWMVSIQYSLDGFLAFGISFLEAPPQAMFVSSRFK